MSGFDVAIALTQDELNNGSQQVYSKLYPRVFTGSQNVSLSGFKTVSWDVKAAPSFDLSTQAVETVAEDLYGQAVALAAGDTENACSLEDATALVAELGTTFVMDCASVDMTLVQDSGEKKTIQLQNVTGNCLLTTTGNSPSFQATSVTSDPVSDETTEFFVKLVILPALENMLNSLFTGLKIPPLSLGGISLSLPSLAITDAHVVVAANLASKGTPAPAGAGSWTGSPLSILMSRDALQSAASGQTTHVYDSDHKGSKFSGYVWYKFSYNIDRPSLSIAGSDVNISFSLHGSIGAGFEIVYIPIGLDYAAKAVPGLSAMCRLQPSGSKLELISESVAPFTIEVKPTGSISSKVLSWMLEFIVQGVVGTLSPVVSAFLGGIKFASMDMPTYTESIAGVTVTMTPANLSVTNVSGYLAMGGNLSITFT